MLCGVESTWEEDELVRPMKLRHYHQYLTAHSASEANGKRGPRRGDLLNPINQGINIFTRIRKPLQILQPSHQRISISSHQSLTFIPDFIKYPPIRKC